MAINEEAIEQRSANAKLFQAKGESRVVPDLRRPSLASARWTCTPAWKKRLFGSLTHHNIARCPGRLG